MRYPCSKCDFAATRANVLKKHVENKHEGVRYPCSQCEYSATTANHLKRHVESEHERSVKIKHVGVRFPCDKCEYAATRTLFLFLLFVETHVLYLKFSYLNVTIASHFLFKLFEVFYFMF